MPPERDPQAEIEKLEQRFAENPEGRMFAHLADAYRKAGELDQAERIILDGLDRHPDYVSAHLVLGRVYMDGGRIEEAGRQFRRTLELDPHNLIALKALGDLAVQKGASGKARSWYERMLQVDPYNDEAQAALEGLGAGSPDVEAPVSTEADPPAVGPTAPPEPEEDLSGLEITEPLPEAQEAGRDVESEFDAASSGPRDEPERSERPEGFFSEEPAPEPEDAGRAETSELESEADSEPVGSEGSDEPDAGELDIDFEEMDAWSPGLVQEEDFEGEQMDDEELLGPSETEGEEDDVVTETMAELYMGQGLHREALEIYRQLGEVRPHDEQIRARIRELEERLGTGADEELEAAAADEEGWEAAMEAGPELEEPAAEAELEEPVAEAGFEEPAAEPEFEEPAAEAGFEEADAFGVEPGDVEELFASAEGSVEEPTEPTAHPELEATGSETDIDAEESPIDPEESPRRAHSADGELEFEVRAPAPDDLEKIDPFAASFEYRQEMTGPSLFEEEATPPADASEAVEVGPEEPDLRRERAASEEGARPETDEIAASSHEVADLAPGEPGWTEPEPEEQPQPATTPVEPEPDAREVAEEGPAPISERQEESIRSYLLELLHPTAGANGSAEDVTGASSGGQDETEGAGLNEYGAESEPPAEGSDEPEDLAQFQEWLRSLKR